MPTVLRAVECALLFAVAPLLMRVAMFDYGVPLFWALVPVLGIVAALIAYDPSFDWRSALLAPIAPAALKSILLLFAAGAPLALLAVSILAPDLLFNLPRERTRLWAKIMLLYPFTSVLAQELIFRVFFFHRYALLFAHPKALVLASALAFAFSHVVFRNDLALALTFAGGLLFSWRYGRTRSFAAVWLEHTLWGWLLFTGGLGVYFFANSKNPAWG